MRVRIGMEMRVWERVRGRRVHRGARIQPYSIQCSSWQHGNVGCMAHEIKESRAEELDKGEDVCMSREASRGQGGTTTGG